MKPFEVKTDLEISEWIQVDEAGRPRHYEKNVMSWEWTLIRDSLWEIHS
jgi:hypothetical protein